MSGAGFEAVGMADNIRLNGYKMEMAVLSDSTRERLSNMLKDKQLEHLTEAGNPLDINPSADDDAHIRAIKYLAEDPNVDAIVAIQEGWMTATAWANVEEEGRVMVETLEEAIKAGDSWQPKAVEVPVELVNAETIGEFLKKYPQAMQSPNQ